MASTDSIPQAVSRLFKAMVFSRLTSKYEKQLQRLVYVDVRNCEGRTLLQEAVVHGRRDWVEALIEVGADPGIGLNHSSETALKLARELTDRHPGNANRRAIHKLLHVVATWHARRKVGGRAEPDQQFGDVYQGESQPMTPRDATGSEYGVSIEEVHTWRDMTPLSKKILETSSEVHGKLTSLVETSGNSGVGATYLFRKMLSIKESLQEVSKRINEMSEETTTGSTAAEEEVINPNLSTLDGIDLSSLEHLLGVTLANCGRNVLLPHDRWQRLHNMVDEDGCSLLMKAARGGACDCVELLLRCGCDINASRVSGGEERRAIDFAVEEGHHKVVLLLLQWDSALPKVSTPQSERDDDIQNFLKERDDFLASIKDGDIAKVEKILERKRDILRDANYWVDRKSRSSLYWAAYSEKFDVWALLKSNKFECLKSEFENMKALMKEDETEFNRAMGNYFRDVEDCHVYKIMSRTRVLEHVKEPRWAIEYIYKEANKVPQAKLLLECLQDEPHFEVIFEMQRSDITSIYLGCAFTLPGIQDSQLDRVYVSASLGSLSDVVSNLVHELTHKVMHLLFGNRGLPYKEEDLEKKDSYGKIAKTILSPRILKGCNEIIKRVKKYKANQHLQELIVRIPEIVTKHQLDYGNTGSNPWQNKHEKKLYDYYCNHVEPEIKKQIKTNYASRRMPICDVLSYPALLSNHISDDIQVIVTEEPTRGYHHDVGFIQVSNLKQGLSHLKKSLKNLVYVDWTKFRSLKTILESRLRRGTYANLAVVWDEEMGSAFCTDPDQCVESCPANIFLDLKEYVTLLVPKKFTVHQEIKPVEYSWGHLSEKTKTWVWSRSMEFQGRKATLREVIESAVGGDDSAILSTLLDESASTLLDADDISQLIDGKTFKFGRNIADELAERRRQLLRDHPTSFIERRMTVRPIDLKEALIAQRTSDAVFISNANKEDLRDANIPNWQKWDGEDTPKGIRFFLLDVHAEGEQERCKGICEILKSSTEGNWQLAHFFRCEDKKFLHIYSQIINVERCQLLADVPGSGKSVLANSAAKQEKETHPERWVELVELTEHEGMISQWNENDSESNLEEFLFQLIDGRSNISHNGKPSFGEKVFKKFCHSKGKLSIYVDGFDEICPDHKEKCSSLLEALLKKTSATLFLTTRTHEYLHLEKQLSIFAFNLIPFDKKDQVEFMNAEWNGLLRSLERSEKDKKIRSIISNVKARSQSEENVKLVENLEKLLPLNAIPKDRKIKFDGLAEEMIKIEKPKAGNEEYLCDIPLHSWMLASVCFQESFIHSNPLRRPHLYNQFIDFKIKIYSSEKAKASKRELAKTKEKYFAKYMLQLLKQFAAFFFLGHDAGKKFLDEDIDGMLRVGLLIKKENNSNLFIHRTIGEYLFSIWLLQEAADKDVTKVFLSRVLLESQFESVRKFIDEILLSQNENRSQQNEENIGYKNILPSTSAFPDYLVKVIQNSFYKSIEECHIGVFQSLVDFSGENLADVLFGEADGGSETLTNIRFYCMNLNNFDAFSVCGWFTKAIQNSMEGRIESLKILQTLLMLTEKYGLIENLRVFISKVGLRWTGVDWDVLWSDKEVRAQFNVIFDFLLKHSNVLGEALKEKIMDKESRWLFANASNYNSFDLLKRLLDSTLKEKDFEKLLVPSSSEKSFHSNGNMVTAWTRVILCRSVVEVEQVWNYLESKLPTREKRKEFLRRKDYEGRNGIVAAFIRRPNDDVITFVSRLIEREFSQGEWKELMRESLLGEHLNPVTSQKKEDFEKSVTEVIRTRFQSLEEAYRHLRSRERYRVPIRTISPREFTLSKILKMQHQLTVASQHDSARGEMKESLKRTAGYLKWLGVKCFSELDELESSVVHGIRKEVNGILPTLSLHLPAVDIPLDEEGCLVGVLDYKERRVKGDGLIAYLVLLWRRLELESEYFTARELKERIQRELFGIYRIFPISKFTAKTGRIWMTKSLHIQYFFAVLSAFLSKKELSEVLLHVDYTNYQRNVFQLALDNNDPMAFLTLYDLARLFLGEDSVWKVHSILRKEKSILEFLLLNQNKGSFEKPIPTIQDNLASYSSEKVWDLRSYSLRMGGVEFVTSDSAIRYKKYFFAGRSK